MKLERVWAEFLEFGGEWDWEQPLRVRLEFVDARPVRISLASDGESVRLDSLPLEGPADLGECGAILIRDLSYRCAPDLLGADLVIQGIAVGDVHCVGIALVHERRAVLCFWNLGDELIWGDWRAVHGCDWDGQLPRLVPIALA